MSSGTPSDKDPSQALKEIERKLKEFEDLARSGNLTVKVETPEHPSERTSRLSRQDADAGHARRKDIIVSVFIGVGVLGVGAVCAYVLVGAGFSPEDKKWAQTTLTHLLTACLSYIVGKSQSKS